MVLIIMFATALSANAGTIKVTYQHGDNQATVKEYNDKNQCISDIYNEIESMNGGTISIKVESPEKITWDMHETLNISYRTWVYLDLGGGTLSRSDKGGCLVQLDKGYGDGYRTNFVLSNATLTGGYNTDGGGGIHIDALEATVELHNTTIKNCHAEQSALSDGHGGGICAYGEYPTIKLDNSHIINNTAYNNGGGIYVDQSTSSVGIVLTNGSTISGNEAQGEAYINTGLGGGIGTSDCVLYDGANYLYVQLSGGSKINNNYACKKGGGIYSGNERSVVTVDGKSQISYNQAWDGGGIYEYNPCGTITLDGGSSMSKNMAGGVNSDNQICEGGSGGAIYMENIIETPLSMERWQSPTITIKGQSQIANNDSWDDGGGIYSEGWLTTVNVEDNGIMRGNRSYNGDGGAIYIDEDSVKVHMKNNGQIIDNRSEGSGGGIYLKGDEPVIECEASDNGAASIINNNIAKEDGGGIYLEGDDAVIECKGNGNGEPSTINYNHAIDQGGGICLIGAHTRITLDKAHVSGNVAGNYETIGAGGGIYVSDDGDALLELKNNSCVDNNESNGRGGGIFMTAGTPVIECKGTGSAANTINDNSADDDGGGIAMYGEDGIISLSNTKISRNSAGPDSDDKGGGIYITNKNASVTLRDHSDIADNTAGGDGGGISMGDKCHETKYRFVSNGTVDMGSYCYIYSNVSHGYGGGICADCSDFSVSTEYGKQPAKIHNNRSYKSGGGVYFAKDNNLLSNVDVELNTSYEGSGGGIYANGFNNRIVASTINSNSAASYGGGVFLNGGETSMKNCTVTSNTAYKNGGGVYPNSGANTVLTLEGTDIISGNEVLKGEYGDYRDAYGNDLVITDSIKINPAALNDSSFIQVGAKPSNLIKVYTLTKGTGSYDAGIFAGSLKYRGKELQKVENRSGYLCLVDYYSYRDDTSMFPEQYAGEEALSAPKASLMEGEYLDKAKVKLTADEDAVIRYTLDGSYPMDGEEYNKDVVLDREDADSKTFTLKAIAVKGDMASDVMTAEYTVSNRVEVPEAMQPLKYKGKEQVIVGGYPEYYTLSSDDEGITIGEDGHAYATNAGEYTVTAKIADGYQWKIRDKENSGYVGTLDDQIIKASIDKAETGIEMKDQAVEYSGEPQAYDGIEVKGSKKTPVLTYFADEDCMAEVAPEEVINVGVYYVKASVAEDGNYEAAEAGPAKFEIVEVQKTAEEIKLEELKKMIEEGNGDIKKLQAQILLLENPIVLKTKTVAIKDSSKVKVTVSWNKIDGATYIINGEEVTGTSKSYTVARGKTYTYKVQAKVMVNDEEIIGKAAAATVKPVPKKVVVSSSKNIKVKKIKTSWKKTAGAKYYQVSVSTSKSKIKYATKKTTKLTYTKSKLKKGKTYYVKVRAVGANGKKGSWSTVKKIKVKK